MHSGARVLEELPGLLSLAKRQSGVLSRHQLASFEVDNKSVAGQVAGRRWATIGSILVVMHRGPLTDAARRWAAVLNAGPGAALCAWSALAEWGLRGWEPARVHVVIRRGGTPDPLPWVRIHESRRHHLEDVVHRGGGPPVHAAARAAVDGAAWEQALRSGCGLLAATVQQRLASPESLFAALDIAGRVRHRKILAATLHDIAGGSDALSEIDFVRFCASQGLPAPLRQSLRLDVHGRRRYRDLEWRRADGRVVLGEIDGMGHFEVRQWYDDMMRTPS